MTNNSSSKSNNIILSTTCDIIGNSKACPSTTNYYNYEGSSSSSTVTWSVTSGDISIISGQGTTHAQFSFGSNFESGIISAYGEGQETCSVSKTILKEEDGTFNDACNITQSIEYKPHGPNRHTFSVPCHTGVSYSWNIYWEIIYMAPLVVVL
ncbi:hypothetical protein LVD15_19155 [Fulvivirga maritima]|uniref:hypothetical protein n=1 Tax=Fulvivirga maritima TaxID=2904247 RepID=UPI001F217017|nr:hypothetical protein [Fulvivirga maritima]UII25405.1 hypothetical protein LVD15_19155 [Fulvivirga maritima]